MFPVAVGWSPGGSSGEFRHEASIQLVGRLIALSWLHDHQQTLVECSQSPLALGAAMCIVRPFGDDFPKINHDSRVREDRVLS